MASLAGRDFLSNTAFGWINALGNARPSLVPKLAELSGRALAERTFSDSAHKVFTSPRKVVFREMEYAVPREVGLEALREVRALVETRLEDQLPGRDPGDARRRHPPLHGV